MSQNRIEILTQFIQKDPKDSFARFGLAMEYARLDEADKALEHFRILREINPNYIPAYFQAGKLLAKIGQRDEARKILDEGIGAAGRVGDLHAKSEMEAELSELLRIA